MLHTWITDNESIAVISINVYERHPCRFWGHEVEMPGLKPRINQKPRHDAEY